ncbi:MAG: hypothetical protein M1814_006775 [Vezdaea aestivalis]|nr:MAG: hypothetical protein M1814_006775 [Vezdaea aestivalis]
MTYPPPPPSSLSSAASTLGQVNSSAAPATAQASSAQPQSVTLDNSNLTRQRALSPISTATSQSSLAQRHPTLAQASPAASSPFTSSFSSILNSSARTPSARVNTPQSARTPSSQAGSQAEPVDHSLSSPRPKFNTQPSYSQAFTGSATSSSQAPAPVSAGGSGSAAVPAASSGTRNSISFSSNVTSPTSASFGSSPLPSQNSGQFSNIIIAQVLILLSTMKADDPVKQAAMADQIKKLVDNSDDREVWAKYFRKLVMANAPAVFPNPSKPSEKAPNYSMLDKEMQQLTTNTQQAVKVALALSGGTEELFRDFNLLGFMDHFELDPVEKFVLAVACKEFGRSDLQTKDSLTSTIKADAICVNIYSQFRGTLAFPTSEGGQKYSDLSPSFIGYILYRLIHNPFSGFGNELQTNLRTAMLRRYSSADSQSEPGAPTSILIPLTLYTLMDKERDPLVWHIGQIGPSLTESVEHCKETLRPVERHLSDPLKVASALIYMAAHERCQDFKLENFVKTVRDRIQDWQQVIRGCDQEFVALDPDRFMILYEALYPIAIEDSKFDIQGLWAGEWSARGTQLYFHMAFMKLDPSKLDAASIPRLRLAFDESDFEDAPAEVQEYGKAAMRTPFVSLEAISAMFYLAFQDQESLANSPYDRYILHEIIKPKIDLFICAALRTEKARTETQNELIVRAFASILMDKQPHHDFLLHVLWKRHRQWVAQRLFQIHSEDPMTLPRLLETVQEQKWLDDLVVVLNGFGLDLTALAHKRGLLDLEKWAEAETLRMHPDFFFALVKFLNIKAEDQLRTNRNETAGPRTVPLAIKTVNGLLETLDELSDPQNSDLIAVQRHCVAAFPRLINFGEEYDEIIEANTEASPTLPPAADEQMQEYFKKMYGAEVEVRDIVRTLQGFKHSRNPLEQDLFACMIHGLFDEYMCFHEYPLEALATTAVLFGGIVNFGLISGIPLKVALGMILEAVRDHRPESSMYKFGLQALTNFKERLKEWAGYCNLLLTVSGLRGTDPYDIAERVVRERASENAQEGQGGQAKGMNGADNDSPTVTNGNVDEAFPVEPAQRPFACLRLGSLKRSDLFDNPTEDVQDKVLFVLNNISERNFDTKVTDLIENLREPHYRWFAQYLVVERAKLQPNFHKLYLNVLDKLSNDLLDDEVLRETYDCVINLLNSQTIMQSVPERGHLKNLGGWLGSLTLAKEKMVVHKHIPLPELLIEAHDSKRLLAVIPFVCKTMAQGVGTQVFKPTNAWVTKIIRQLIELYHHGDLKLNAKFEIEVLCKTYGLDHTAVEAATTIRDRPLPDDDLAEPAIQGAFEGGLNETAIGFPRSAARTERFNSESIIASMPDMSSQLTFPPTAHTGNQTRLRQIVQAAFQRAAGEIVTPVVERSVTIAALSTQQLVQKDFATEVTEARLRAAAVNMVKSLAGSLALVTCKEPLRVSVTNYIRVMSAELGDQAPAEGVILMCVNDNLDTVCQMVEKAAEERAVPEIEEHIAPYIRARQQHIASHRNGEPFVDPVWSQWSSYIPEPYKPSTNGLNKQQLTIYEEFTRYPKNAMSHTSAPSIDNGRPPTVDPTTEQLPPMPNLSTPSEQPIAPRQMAPPQSQQRVLPAALIPQPQMNGFADPKSISERLQAALGEIKNTANASPPERLRDLAPQSPLLQIVDRILSILAESEYTEELMINTARWISTNLYKPIDKAIEVEVLVSLLVKVGQKSPAITKEVLMWLASQPDEQLLNTKVTTALVEAGMMDLQRVDQFVSKALLQPHLQTGQQVDQQLQVVAIEFLEDLMDDVIFSKNAIGFRTDFAHSVEAMHEVLDSDMSGSQSEAKAQHIIDRLRVPNKVLFPSSEHVDTDHQLKADIQYAFMEWAHLCSLANVNERSFASFVCQLGEKHDMTIAKHGGVFMRTCLDTCLADFAKEALGGLVARQDAYAQIDSLAKLIIYISKYRQDEENFTDHIKSDCLESLLGVVVMTLMAYHETSEQHSHLLFYRFYSALMFEERNADLTNIPGFKKEAMLIIGESLLRLQPKYCPGYVFQWLSIVGHRVFMPAMLIYSNIDGWKVFAKIIEALLDYVGKTLSPSTIAPAAKELYRGVLRVILVLHHDFPEFLAENHLQLCSVIPPHCTQLRNLILSAYPSSFPELPDPFTAGLKVDRIAEIRTDPAIASDIETPIREAKIKDLVDACINNDASDQQIKAICEALYSVSNSDDKSSTETSSARTSVLNALVLYVGSSAIKAVQQSGGPTFVPTSRQAILLSKLVHALEYETRYYFLSAVANQLRYPNSHTHYFSYSLLQLFNSDLGDEAESEIKQQITRVLLERLIVHRPHPWGLIITLLELLKNPDYMFWDLPFIKAAPEIERLFAALVQHVNSGGGR